MYRLDNDIVRSVFPFLGSFRRSLGFSIRDELQESGGLRDSPGQGRHSAVSTYHSDLCSRQQINEVWLPISATEPASCLHSSIAVEAHDARLSRILMHVDGLEALAFRGAVARLQVRL